MSDDSEEIPFPAQVHYLRDKVKMHDRVLFGNQESSPPTPGLVQNVAFIIKLHYFWPSMTLTAIVSVMGTLIVVWLKSYFHL